MTSSNDAWICVLLQKLRVVTFKNLGMNEWMGNVQSYKTVWLLLLNTFSRERSTFISQFLDFQRRRYLSDFSGLSYNTFSREKSTCLVQKTREYLFFFKRWSLIRNLWIQWNVESYKIVRLFFITHFRGSGQREFPNFWIPN